MAEPKSAAERAAHARELLETELDAWVASASASGDAYLIPLSFLWDGESLLFSTPVSSRTAKDLLRAGRTRVCLPSARDVVIMDGSVHEVDPEKDVLAVDAFAARHDWDPRREPNAYAFLRFTPAQVQAWSVVEELPDRIVMRDGRWADDEKTVTA